MSRPLPSAADLARHYVDYYEAYGISKTLSYSALTLLVWDMLLTFGDEVRYVWKARFTFIKVLFFFNRYLSPLVVSINLWASTGHATGLTDHFCRVWISFLYLTQVLGMSLVSLMVTFRLYALEEINRTTCFFLFVVWGLSLVAGLGLLFKNYFLAIDTVHVLPGANICFAVLPRIWENSVPIMVEHAIFFLFLLARSLKIPRSAQTPLLAIMYRHGIFYFAFTMIIFVLSFVTWRFLDLKWFSIPLLSTWLLCQLATSRLLLGVKSSQAFQQFLSSPFSRPRTTAAPSSPEYISGIRTTGLCATQKGHDKVNVSNAQTHRTPSITSIPLQSLVAASIKTGEPQHKFNDTPRHLHVGETDAGSRSLAADRPEGHSFEEETEVGDTRSFSHDLPDTQTRLRTPKSRNWPRGEEGEPSQEERRENGTLHRVLAALPWWLVRRSHQRDLHIQVVCDGDGMEMSDWEATGDAHRMGVEGGLRVSRLGRYDHWF